MESKECIYCGKELHMQASFCPYCMQSQIEKETFPVGNPKHRKRWVIPVCMILLMAVMIFLVLKIFSSKPDEPVNGNFHETSTSTTELTTTIPTTTSFTIEKQSSETETNITTTIQTDTVMTTVTTIPTATASPPLEAQYYLGDYITSEKSYSEVTYSGGIILTFTEQSGNTFTFNIVKYDESGSAADTVTARKIHGEKVDNQILFSFVDDRDNSGTGTLTFQDGKLHLQTSGEGTKLFVDTWLEYDSGLFPN